MSWFVTVDIAISKLSGKLFNVQNLVDFKIEDDDIVGNSIMLAVIPFGFV